MAANIGEGAAGLRQRSSAKSSSKATTSDLTPRRGNIAPPGSPPPFSVYVKFALFSAAMFLLPLLTYYIALPRVGGSSTWAGGLAAVSANVVLIGYVIAAFLEDDGTGGGTAANTGLAASEKSDVGDATQAAQGSKGSKGQ